jgi:hypothetical protein
MTAKINMRTVQENVEDNSKKAREFGRKAMLAYLGMWGMGYDAGKSMYSDGWKWVEKAEKRGEKVEKELTKVAKAYQKDFPGEVSKLAHSAEETAKDVAKDVTGQADKVSKSMQKYWNQYVSHPAAETVEEIGVKAVDMADSAVAQAQVVVNEAAEAAQERLEEAKLQAATAVDGIWKGYDELSVKEIAAGIEKKSMQQLEELRDYEIGNKNRVTVLREIDARMQAMTS